MPTASSMPEDRRALLAEPTAATRVVAGDAPRAALALGYADQAHFINAFREATGRPPGRYPPAP